MVGFSAETRHFRLGGSGRLPLDPAEIDSRARIQKAACASQAVSGNTMRAAGAIAAP